MILTASLLLILLPALALIVLPRIKVGSRAQMVRLDQYFSDMAASFSMPRQEPEEYIRKVLSLKRKGKIDVPKGFWVHTQEKMVGKTRYEFSQWFKLADNGTFVMSAEAKRMRGNDQHRFFKLACQGDFNMEGSVLHFSATSGVTNLLNATGKVIVNMLHNNDLTLETADGLVSFARKVE